MARRSALDAPGAGGAAPQHSHPFARAASADTLPPRLADKDTHVSTQNSPGGLPPDEQRSDVRATVQTEHDLAVERLHALGDDELAKFSSDLDGVLADVRNTPAAVDIEDVVDLATCARILLRRRRQVAQVRCARQLAEPFLHSQEVIGDAVYPR